MKLRDSSGDYWQSMQLLLICGRPQESELLGSDANVRAHDHGPRVTGMLQVLIIIPES